MVYHEEALHNYFYIFQYLKSNVQFSIASLIECIVVIVTSCLYNVKCLQKICNNFWQFVKDSRLFTEGSVILRRLPKITEKNTKTFHLYITHSHFQIKPLARYFPFRFLHLLCHFSLCCYNIIFYPPHPFKFQIVTFFALLVIICKTLKKKGCAFRNIGYFTNIVVSVPLISLAFLSNRFIILQLIRSFATGSGASILLYWSFQIQLLVFNISVAREQQGLGPVR